MAEDYITPNFETEYWRKHINGMILHDYSDYITGNVLNIGCNHGAESELISELPLVNYVIGVDINSEAIKLANTRNLSKVSFYVLDIIEGLGSNFDSIVCLHTLEHINDIHGAIQNIFDSLLNGGYIIVSVPYNGAYPSEHHIHEFTEKSLQELFWQFDIIECYRDQRVDGHGNQQDVLNLVAEKR